MIEEGKQERLDAFADALEEAGYEVLEAEPKLEKTIAEKVDHEEDDTVGFLVVRTPVELKGAEFEGELVVTVHEDHLSTHGVDVYSDPEDPIPDEKQRLLDTLVPSRTVTDDDGKTWRVWSYYTPPEDLPDDLVDESRDNVDELLDEFAAIYESTSAA